jgi:hypothetical protein
VHSYATICGCGWYRRGSSRFFFWFWMRFARVHRWLHRLDCNGSAKIQIRTNTDMGTDRILEMLQDADGIY